MIIVFVDYILIYSFNSVKQIRRSGGVTGKRKGGAQMSRLKILENVLKAASALAAALMSIVKFIGVAVGLKTAKA